MVSSVSCCAGIFKGPCSYSTVTSIVASAANFVSESVTQNLRAPMSAMLAMAGLAGVTLGITAGFERIAIVDSGKCQMPSVQYRCRTFPDDPSSTI